MSELGRRVDMSAPAVSERVQRLERAGVIRGYRLEVDPAALGLPISAFVRVRPAPGQLPKVVDLAERLGQVSECHRITGEDCFLIKIPADVPSSKKHSTSSCATARPSPSIVVTTPVPDRPLPLPEVPTP